MTDVPFQLQFPSADETLDYAKLSEIVYKVNSIDDPNLNSIPLQFPVTCHYFGENTLDTQVMIVSCDYDDKTITDTTKNIVVSNSEVATEHKTPEEKIQKSNEHKLKYDGFIAVVYRGTSSVRDLNLDIDSFLKIFDQPLVNDEIGNIHSGFNNLFIGDNLHNSITEHLDIVRKFKPNHKIVFTGHSLGAAVSTLAAVYTALRLPKHNILNINFGSPRVGDNDFKLHVENNVKNCAIWRCALDDDIVTRLPPLSLEYEHVGHTIDFDRKKGGFAYFFHLGNKEMGYVGVDQKAWDFIPDSGFGSAIEDHKNTNYIAYLEKQHDKNFPNKFLRVSNNSLVEQGSESNNPIREVLPAAKPKMPSSDNEGSTPSPKRAKKE